MINCNVFGNENGIFYCVMYALHTTALITMFWICKTTILGATLLNECPALFFKSYFLCEILTTTHLLSVSLSHFPKLCKVHFKQLYCMFFFIPFRFLLPRLDCIFPKSCNHFLSLYSQLVNHHQLCW